MRLVVCLGVYGSALGASSLLVSFLARTRFPREPEHLELLPSVFLSSGGWIMGAIIAGLIGYLIAPTSVRPQNIIIWLLIGFAFGVLLPFFSGALMPVGTAYLDIALGVTPLTELPSLTMGAILRAPAFAVTQGTFGLFTGLLAGALFGAGAWMIDMANTLPYPHVSRYIPYALSLSLSVVFVAIAAYGPVDALAKLG